MKKNSIVTLALLLVMSFSLIHEYVFAMHDNDQCSTTEYVNEFEGPTSHSDLHDIHFEYHHSYVLPQYNTLTQVDSTNMSPAQKNDSYLFKTYLELFKPPIT